MKVICYNKYDEVISCFGTIIIELKLFVSFIYRRKSRKTAMCFTILKEECIGKLFYDLKQQDKALLYNDVHMKILQLISQMLGK